MCLGPLTLRHTGQSECVGRRGERGGGRGGGRRGGRGGGRGEVREEEKVEDEGEWEVTITVSTHCFVVCKSREGKPGR